MFFCTRLKPIFSSFCTYEKLSLCFLLHVTGFVQMGHICAICHPILLFGTIRLLGTQEYHLSPASCVFSPNLPTCAIPLIYSFLILSILVTPNENHNIFNYATSISASCFFVSATVSNPFNIAVLTATLYTFPFTLAGTRLSQITPDILLHPFHHACTLLFTSLPHSPLLCTVFEILHFRHLFSLHFHCAVILPLIHTQVICKYQSINYISANHLIYITFTT